MRAPTPDQFETILQKIVSGIPVEKAATEVLSCRVKDWETWLEGNQARHDDVLNAIRLMLADVEHRLTDEARKGNLGAARQLLDNLSDKFKKTTTKDAKAAKDAGGIMYIIVSDFPDRRTKEQQKPIVIKKGKDTPGDEEL